MSIVNTGSGAKQAQPK